jgi:hypothetical protein
VTRFRFLLVALALAIVTGGACQAAPSLQKITVYLQNPTSGKIPFNYRKGGDPWYKSSIQPGYTSTMTGIAPHQISYQNGKGKVLTNNLRHGKTYYFQWSNGVLTLFSR